MKKKYYAFFAVVLSASLILSSNSTLAVDITTQPNPETPAKDTIEPATSPVDNSTLSLSLVDALKAMETGNSLLKLSDSKLLIYDKQNQQALARHDANTPVVDLDSKKERDLNHKRTQWILDNAKHDGETQLKALKVQITNEYQSILILQEQAENLKTQIANLDTIINQANLQINLGLKIPSDIYSYNAQKSRLEAAQKAVLNNIKSSLISLKQNLGIDINRNIVLTSSPIQYTKFDDSDLNSRVAKAIQTNYDLERYKQDIEITQIEYDIDFYYDDPMADQVQLSIEDKKATLANLPVKQEVELKTAYNTLKTLENAIEADKLSLEADQIKISVLQKNIEVGNSSSLEMIALQNTLLNDQYTLRQDINAYMTAATNLQDSLDQ